MRIEASSLVGRVLGGRYRVIRSIGEGGMGAVFEAEQLDLARRVALKILTAVDAHSVVRLRREAMMAGSLQSPHVVTIFDFVANADEPPFLVMEMLPGESLGALLRRERRLEPARASALAVQMLAGLESAHQVGITHRDVKPSNVWITRSASGAEHVKILDFGIAKALDEPGVLRTSTGEVLGTPAYLSPEQLRGLRADARSDVHAVGVVMFEMLTGGRPWQPSGASPISEILQRVPPPVAAVAPGTPQRLSDVIERALAKDPRARFTRAADMAEALVSIFPSGWQQAPSPATFRGGPPGTLGPSGADPTKTSGPATAPNPLGGYVITPPTQMSGPPLGAPPPGLSSPPSGALPLPPPLAGGPPSGALPFPAPAVLHAPVATSMTPDVGVRRSSAAPIIGALAGVAALLLLCFGALVVLVLGRPSASEVASAPAAVPSTNVAVVDEIPSSATPARPGYFTSRPAVTVTPVAITPTPPQSTSRPAVTPPSPATAQPSAAPPSPATAQPSAAPPPSAAPAPPSSRVAVGPARLESSTDFLIYSAFEQSKLRGAASKIDKCVASSTGHRPDEQIVVYIMNPGGELPPKFEIGLHGATVSDNFWPCTLKVFEGLELAPRSQKTRLRIYYRLDTADLGVH